MRLVISVLGSQREHICPQRTCLPTTKRMNSQKNNHLSLDVFPPTIIFEDEDTFSNLHSETDLSRQWRHDNNNLVHNAYLKKKREGKRESHLHFLK
mmetsp:Transcript_26239/g.57483  ORF Transcript_26239/g.57483 Transcript_26239/m.57483 type:complete len:96 (+) Transcript_26239:49-336(+)